MRLIKGTKYEFTSLKFEDWTEGDGSGSMEYNVAHYFDAEGRYLGPDAHGIEPIFDMPEGVTDTNCHRRFRRRWNIELTQDGLRLCRGHHLPYQDCEWEYFIPKFRPIT